MNNAIFQSEWAGSASVGATAFTFSIPVTNGAYEVRLYFAELTKNAVNQRTFDVQLEGATVLSNYDIFAEVGQNVATMEAFPVTISDGAVSFAFIKRIENPKLSAIAIVPAEEAGLLSDNGQLNTVEQRMQARSSDYRIYLAFLTSLSAASSQDNADLSNAAVMTNATFESVGAGASFSCGLTTAGAIVC